MLGYQLAPKDSERPGSSDGLRIVEPARPLDAPAPQVRVLAPEDAPVQAVFIQPAAYAWMWGTPAHPDIERGSIAGWSADLVADERYECFRELIGTFAVVVDEPFRSRITLVTDPLGVRPVFFGSGNGQLVFGSDVWQIRKLAPGEDRIDYDAVSSWIAYGYNCTGGSLFRDLQRVSPGSAVVFEGGDRREIPYARFDGQRRDATQLEIARDLHGIVRNTVEYLLRDVPRANIALSGGFDSRYLAALASQSRSGSELTCGTVGVTDEETTIAISVAESLDLRQVVFPVDGTEWDLHANVYHAMADGFPISKSVTDYLCDRLPPAPMMNGFMGDSLMRGSHDRINGRTEIEYDDSLPDVLQEHHEVAGYEILRPEIAVRVRERARTPMEHAVLAGARAGSVFDWVDFYYRQRHYISNNFLQHVGREEALLPFYSWPLLSYKMGCRGVFDHRIYEHIFATYFPALSGIPRASGGGADRGGMARCARRWAALLLPRLAGRRSLSLLRRARAALMLAAGVTGDVRAESSVFFMMRLRLLEERCRAASIDFDWEQI